MLKGIPVTLDYTDVGIGNSKLSRLGLLITQVVKDEGEIVEPPGPWASSTDPERIKTALVFWIEELLSSLEARVMGQSGCTLSLEKLGDAGETNGIYLMIHYPYEVTVIFCDILPKIKTTDKSLSAVVIAAFQMLCWFKTTYTYDDCLEQYQDWSEEQLNDNGMENEEIEAIKSELLWIEHNIPEDYHFLLRNKERPEFPLFPECPPASEWTHPWWQWAKEVFDKSLSWKEPIPYFPHHDLLPETCVLDPGYFTPFLWAPSDPLSGYFSEMLDSEYQGGSEPFGILPFNNTIEIREAVHLPKRSSECFDLVLKASHLPDPPEQDRKEETPS